MIRILIADDHPLIREGLKKTLQAERGMEVVCEASNGQEVLDLVNKHDLDIIIMDLSMPGIGGLDVIKELKRQKYKVPILILSMHPEERFAIRVLKAGGAGYLSKENAPDNLVDAIHKIVSGRKYITPTLAERLAFELEERTEKLPHEELSDREFQVLCMLASGVSIKEISDKLFLSINTVNTYKVRIYEKLKIQSVVDLTHYALKYHLIDSNEDR